jgi:sugar phosphate isomerase/epimerase
LQRASRPDRRAAHQKAEQQEVEHALQQPHRRMFNGSARSQLAADGDRLGRFILLNHLREELYDSACSFAKLVRRYLKAAGIKFGSLSGYYQFENPHVKTTKEMDEPNMQLARRLGAEIASLESQLRRAASSEGFAAFKDMVVFNVDCPPQHGAEVIACLRQLAEITGHVRPSGEPKRKPRIRHWRDETPFDAAGESVN